MYIFLSGDLALKKTASLDAWSRCRELNIVQKFAGFYS